MSIKFGDVNNSLMGMAIQSDDKIVVAGAGLGGGSGQLVRLDSDGSFDSTFGNNGFVALFPATPGPLVIQPNGQIVLVGTGLVRGVGGPEMQRFNSNGQLDTTFGKGGSVALVFGGSAIALQNDGKFLITSSGFGFGSGTLVRYNSDGSLDTGFGISGQESTLAAPGLATEFDVPGVFVGQIVTAGSITTKASLSGNASGFALMRFDANGDIDATFGTRGGVVTSFPRLPVAAAGTIVTQPNGDIVAGGSAGSSVGRASFALARYLKTGKLDTTFGIGGLVTTSFGSNTTAVINALALQTDGKIVTAGTNGAGDLVVARYLGQ